MQRTGIIFFRQVNRSVTGFVRGVGQRAYFAREVARAFRDPGTYLPETMRQMRNIGVDSLPLAGIVAAFIGSVIALQTRYQLFPGIQLSVVGFIVRQSIVLELAPLLIGLVLTGRVGARMTAEIGTMRVTEQIDALETLAYDPIAYLVVPRLLAAILMLPVLTVFANAIALASGMFTAVLGTDVTVAAFNEGLRLAFDQFQVFYSLFKATLFGGAIAFLCSFEGYVADAGAEGVGRSTARAVVVTSVAILLLDSLTAQFLAKYLTG